MVLTIERIKELRDQTGVSIMQCKKALEEAEGDLAKAKVILAKHSSASAEKKADRELSAGTVGVYVHDGTIGALVVLFSETDFVSKNTEFGALARDLAMQVAATNPAYLSRAEVPADAKDTATAVFEKELVDKPQELREKILEGKLASYFRDQVLLEQPFIKDETKMVRDLLNEASQKFGERVEIGRFARLSAR